MQEAADAARSALVHSRAGLAGRLRVTAVPSFGRAVLAPLLARFREQQPGVRLELLFTERRIDLMRDNVDIAFRLTRAPPEDWVACRCCPSSCVPARCPRRPGRWRTRAPWRRRPCCWPPGHRHRAAAVAPQHQRTHGPGRRQPGRDQRRHGRPAGAGGGIVLAPSYAVQVDLMQDGLVDVLPGWGLPVAGGAMVQALTLPQPLASDSTRTLVRYVREVLAQSPLR